MRCVDMLDGMTAFERLAFANTLSERARECASLKAYPSLDKAKLAAKSFRRDGRELAPRKCGVCGRWHIAECLGEEDE